MYQFSPISRSVFRAYDIRGIIGESLDKNSYYFIGKAIASRLYELERDTVYVARDGRLTSDALYLALVDGLIESGISVIDLGVVPTPMMYYATANNTPIDSGLMVTGSHNPAEYNGLKMVLAGKTLVQSDIDLLFEKVHLPSIQTSTLTTPGQYQCIDLLPEYLERVTQGIQLKRPLKVVVDAGNGVAGPVIPQVLKTIGCEVIPLYCDIDGRFPNHHPDPTIEANLEDLKAKVRETGADIGLALDGDADRLGVVTNTGEMIYPDRLMIIFAKDVIKRNPGAKIVFDVKCTKHLKEAIELLGGEPMMCPTGHSIVKQVMRESGALLAGEMSGHIFFKERWYGFDDAIYSAVRLLEILTEFNLPVSAQFEAIPNSINTPEIKIPIEEQHKFSFMQKLIESVDFPECDIIKIDGIRVEFKEGWGLIRASNTTPCLVARFEADTELELKRIQDLLMNKVEKLIGNI